jgi:hypothetical protein
MIAIAPRNRICCLLIKPKFHRPVNHALLVRQVAIGAEIIAIR